MLRSISARFGGLALVGASVQALNFMSSNSVRADEQQQPVNKEEASLTPPPVTSAAESEEVKRFAAAFLNAEGKATLSAFQSAHSNVIPNPHMTISYDPKGANLAKLATQLGRPVDLSVRAIVTDRHSQTAVVELVKATDDDDGGVPFMVENATPHVTISFAKDGHDGYGPFYSNHLLARAKAAAGTLDKEWKGVLPARDGFESSECEIVVPKERTVLTATLCVSDQWDAAANRCGEEKGCGFCRFMKLGPCGKQFAIWESCIDKCKETEEDFVDKCAQPTLILKQCVDMNPDYYYSVLEEDENQEPSNEASSAEEQAPSKETSSAIVPDSLASGTAGEIEPATGVVATEDEIKQLVDIVSADAPKTATVDIIASDDSKVTSQEADADLITIDGLAVAEVLPPHQVENTASSGGEASSSTTELEEENYMTKG